MRVTGVATTSLPPAGDAVEGSCLVELGSDEEITGIAVATAGARAAIEALANELLIGQDPRGVSALFQRLSKAASTHRSGAGALRAAAALDIALWDLKAKANEEPLWKTLGGSRPRANVHAGVPVLDDARLFEWYARMASELGIRGAALQAGLDAGADLERLGRMRDALRQATRGPTLIIDAAQHWSTELAMRRVREIEEQFDIAWVERISLPEDAVGAKQVSDVVSAAVAVGKGLASPGDFQPHFRQHSIDVLQLDIGAIGISGALQLSDAAFGYELPVTLVVAPANIHAHLSSAMPYFMSMEVLQPEPAAGVYSGDVRIEQGWAIVGDAPGHGLVVDRQALATRRPA